MIFQAQNLFLIFCLILSTFTLKMNAINWMCEGSAPCIRVIKPPGGVEEVTVSTKTYRLEIMVNKQKNNLGLARWWSKQNDQTRNVLINWYRLLESKVRVPITSCRNRLSCTVSLLGSDEVTQSGSLFTVRHFLVEVSYDGKPATSSAEIVIRKEKGFQKNNTQEKIYNPPKKKESQNQMDYDQGMSEQDFLDRQQYNQDNNRRLGAVNEGRHLGVLPKGAFPSLRRNRPQQEAYVSQNDVGYLSLEHAYDVDYDESENQSFVGQASGTGVAFLVIGVLVASVALFYGFRRFRRRRRGRRTVQERSVRSRNRAQQRAAMRKYKEKLKGKQKKRFPFPRSGSTLGKYPSDFSGSYAYIDEDEDFSYSSRSRPNVYQVWKDVKAKSRNFARQAEDSIKASTSKALRASRDAASTVYERRGYLSQTLYAIRNGITSCFYTVKRRLDPCLEYVEYFCDPCFGCLRVCAAAVRQCVKGFGAPFGYRRVAGVETTAEETLGEATSTDEEEYDYDDDYDDYSQIRPSAGPITIQPSFLLKTKLNRKSTTKRQKIQNKEKQYKINEKNRSVISSTKQSKPRYRRQKQIQNEQIIYAATKNKTCHQHSKNFFEGKSSRRLKNRNRYSRKFLKTRLNSRYSSESPYTSNQKRIKNQNFESSEDGYTPGGSTESSRESFYKQARAPTPGLSHETISTASNLGYNTESSGVYVCRPKKTGNRQLLPDLNRKRSNLEYNTESSGPDACKQVKSQESLQGINTVGSNIGYNTESSGPHVPRCSGTFHSAGRRCGLHCIQNRTKSLRRDSSDGTVTIKNSGLSSLAYGDYLTESLPSQPHCFEKNQTAISKEKIQAGDAPFTSSEYSQLPKVLWQTKQGFQRENKRIEALMRHYEKKATACVIIDETSRRQRQNVARLNKISSIPQTSAKNRLSNITSSTMTKVNISSKNLGRISSSFPIPRSRQQLLYLRSKIDRSIYYHNEALSVPSSKDENEQIKEIQKTSKKRPLSTSPENSSLPDSSAYNSNSNTQKIIKSNSIHSSEIDELISDGSVSIPTSKIDWTTSGDDLPKLDDQIDITSSSIKKPKFRSPSEQFSPLCNQSGRSMQTKAKSRVDEGEGATLYGDNCYNGQVINEPQEDSFGPDVISLVNPVEPLTNDTNKQVELKGELALARSRASDSDRQSIKQMSSNRSAAEILQSAAQAFLTSDDDILSNDEDTYEEFWMNQNV